METQKPLLSIKTVIERPFIEVDERRVYIRTRRDLGPAELAKIMTLQGPLVEKLGSGATVDEWQTLASILNEVSTLILMTDPSDAVFSALSILDKVELFSAFTEAAGLTMPRTSPPPEMATITTS